MSCTSGIQFEYLYAYQHGAIVPTPLKIPNGSAAEVAALDAYLAASRSGDPVRISATWLRLKAAQFERKK